MKVLLPIMRVIAGFAAMILGLTILVWLINLMLRTFGFAGLFIPIVTWGAVEYSQLTKEQKDDLAKLAKSKLPEWKDPTKK
jgi:hypothetical protein